MNLPLESIITTAISYAPMNGRFVFTCEDVSRLISLQKVSHAELARFDAKLPEVANYIHQFHGRIGQKAMKSLRLTMEHWRNPTAARNLGGTDFRSAPRAIEPAQHPDYVILTADLYGMTTLPSGTTCAFGRQYGYSSLHDKAWMAENYPGAFEKMHYLLSIGEFSAVELASLVFAGTTTAAIEMSDLILT